MTDVSVSTVTTSHALARRLLDGDQRGDAATRKVITEALRVGSTDPVVHAAALRLAYSVRGDLRLKRSNGRGWILGFHELIQSGHLDAASYALPLLRATYEEVPYLENMVVVFDRLPPEAGSGRERFVDDRASDVQVVRTPASRTVLLAFCGGHHTLGIPMNLLDRWLARLGSHVVYLRDRQKIGYTGGVPALGTDRASTAAALRELIGRVGAESVVCIGTSAGAAGAIRYARELSAERILALSPITGGPEYAERIARQLPPDGGNPWGDLVPMYREGNGVRVHVVYGEGNEGDEQQSLRMAGLPGVTVEALRGWEAHHVIHGLLGAGRLETVLDWLVSGDEVIDLADSADVARSCTSSADQPERRLP
jgi:hypothetical protein